MKKFIAILCACIMLLSLAACSNHNDPGTTPNNSNPGTTESTPDVLDPQKDNALKASELKAIAENTGKAVNYTLSCTYDIDTVSTTNVIMTDGSDTLTHRFIVNLLQEDGSYVLDKATHYIYSDSQGLRANVDTGDTEEFTMEIKPKDLTIATLLDKLIGAGFYDSFAKAMESGEYNIIHDSYKLPSFYFISGDETKMFDEVSIQIRDGKLLNIKCTNVSQILNIELHNIGTTVFEEE